jgi:8-oxo-dGTP pyrophosphatase MutT (NUDIX family)
MAKIAAIRPASTILLLRDCASVDGKSRDEIEVFMMVRHHQIEFNSGALVFPGFRIAAIRETFEESGILLAREKGSATPVDARRAGEIADAHRVALCEHKISFLSILADNGLQLALDALVPYAHWITPEGMPKRFDTWFFLAAAPPDQLGAHDGRESTDSIWVSPREAVEGGETGRFKLPFPTTRNLIRLSKQPNVAAALDHARDMSIVTVMPVMTKTENGRQLRIPREAGYDGEVFEVGAVG